jgi:hypothetical protein
MGFFIEFIELTRLLFRKAKARVNVNGRSTKYFPIQQGVRQGYFLAPYLFLIVGEGLECMVKWGIAKGPN